MLIDTLYNWRSRRRNLMKKKWLALIILAFFVAFAFGTSTVAAFQTDTNSERVDSMLQALNYFIQEFNAVEVYKGLSSFSDLPNQLNFWDTSFYENAQENIFSELDEAFANFEQYDYLEEVISEAYQSQEDLEKEHSGIFRKGTVLINAENKIEIIGVFSGIVSDNTIFLTDPSGAVLGAITFFADSYQPHTLFLIAYDPEKDESSTLRLDLIENSIRLTDEDGDTLDFIFEGNEIIRMVDSAGETDFQLAFDKATYTITGRDNLKGGEDAFSLMINPETNIIALDSDNEQVFYMAFDPEAKEIQATFGETDLALAFDDTNNEIQVNIPGEEIANYVLVFDQATNSIAIDAFFGDQFMTLIQLIVDKAAKSITASSFGEILFGATINLEARTLTLQDESGVQVLGEAEILAMLDSTLSDSEDPEPADEGIIYFHSESGNDDSKELVPVIPDAGIDLN